MKLLALETIERIGSLAALIAEGESLSTISQVSLPSDQRAAQTLLPAIQSLLSDVAWTPGELDAIAVTTGPGSFTGTRLGVTTAKTLAYATGAQLVGVHTLAIIAAGVTSHYTDLWTILDAQRGELFVSKFNASDDLQLWESPDTRIVSADAWLQEIKPGETVCGPPLKKLQDRLPEGVLCAEPKEWKPRAEFVGQVGAAAYREGKTVDVMQLVPEYYRKSAAEEKADLK